MSAADFLRQYISETNLILYGGLLTIVPGSFFMLALYISILRVHFAIKRDGKEPLGLGPIWLIELATAFMVTKSQYNKTIKHQAEHGVDLVPYALIQPYIKPMDRFIARAWIFFGALLLPWIMLDMWLYPDISS
ncbi:hypothetical protein [Nitrincola nitratireducens]|nr:hypothetical protein [Nitrincola nitratireducens]